MKRTLRRAPLLAGAGLLAASMLVVTGSQAIGTLGAGHARSAAVDVKQRQIGTGAMSAKTIVNPRDPAAVDSGTTRSHQADASHAATSPTVARLKPASFATGAIQQSAATPFTPVLDANFDGLAYNGLGNPPDPNAAASPTQIVEVVNHSRLQVYNRSGGTPCATFNLDAFFDKGLNEFFSDPRVIYDNVNNKFAVMVTVVTRPPSPDAPPHLPGFSIIRMAHNRTGDACGAWTTYSLSSLGLNGVDVPDGNLVDQPVIGQDRDAFLFGGASARIDGSNLSYIAFYVPKSCAYIDVPGCEFPIFTTGHFATPASSAGNPMITTSHSYFVASVKGVGYELYRMDNSGSVSSVTLTLQATVAAAEFAKGPPRDPVQPGAGVPIDLDIANPLAFDNRISTPPAYDGTRIWFTHQSGAASHPGVRYGAIDTTTNTVVSSLAYYSGTSDDFNPSIAVGLSGTSRTIFLTWVYTDAGAGLPLSIAVAEVRIGNTGPVPPIVGPEGAGRPVVTLIRGGISGGARFGDYSSVSIDPLNFGQVCAVAANEYFSKASGTWATRISRFGAAGC